MKRLLLLALLSLAACNDDRPPAPTAEESDQLNQTEDLLNQQAANEEGPEDRSPGPSR
ncbi:MAG: hypothetical protein ABI626_05885 [Sphingomicrobium sp.]